MPWVGADRPIDGVLGVAGTVNAMADKISMQADGTLAVPDNPVIPFIEGDGTGVDIWPAAKSVLDAAAAR